MRVYLLNPPFIKNFGRGARWQDISRVGTLYYPIWLSYATALLSITHQVKLVDAVAQKMKKEDVMDDVKKFNPNVVVVDTSFPSLTNDINIAMDIKKETNAFTVIVGPPGSQIPEKILTYNIDAVARWEYDFTLNHLLTSLDQNKNFEDVWGISYKKDGKIIHNEKRDFSNSNDLDTIPFVSKIYDKFLDINHYFLGQSLFPEVQIFTGRGCPNQCTFCAWPQTLSGRKYRVRSISNLLNELEWIQENLKVKEVFFEDDTFTIDKKRVNEFCDEYKKRRLNITWSCNARANTLDYHTMKKMKKANCRLLIAGYESGDEQILKNVKKGITTDDIRSFSNNAKKAGLLTHGDFVIGLPGETKESIQKTKELIHEIKPEILQVSVAMPFPGTELFQWAQNNEYIKSDYLDLYLNDKGYQKAILSYPNLTNEEMMKTAYQILKTYYISTSYIPIAIKQVFRKHSLDEVKRLLYSFKMFYRYLLKSR